MPDELTPDQVGATGDPGSTAAKGDSGLTEQKPVDMTIQAAPSARPGATEATPVDRWPVSTTSKERQEPRATQDTKGVPVEQEKPASDVTGPECTDLEEARAKIRREQEVTEARLARLKVISGNLDRTIAQGQYGKPQPANTRAAYWTAAGQAAAAYAAAPGLARGWLPKVLLFAPAVAHALDASSKDEPFPRAALGTAAVGGLALLLAKVIR
jgi:hypothetical protein